MKMMKRLMALLMALLLCGACALAETEAVQSPDDVMATVNGEAITRAEFEQYYTILCNQYTDLGYDVTLPENDVILRDWALDNAVQVTLMDQKIAEIGMALTEEEKADAAQQGRDDWQSIIDEGLSYYGVTESTSEDERAAMLIEVLATLERAGYTEQSFIDEAVKTALYVKFEDSIVADVAIPDEEVTAYYNELVEADEVAYKDNAAAYEDMQYMNQMYLIYGMPDYYVDLYYRPDGYRRVTHILLEVDETLLATYNDLLAAYEEQQLTLEEGGEVTAELITEAQVEEARLAIIANVQPKIDEINQKLDEGAAFADLIPLYTIDAMNTPETIAQGYEVHMDSTTFVTEFRDAAFTVDNPGDVTAPVVSQFGVHILQYVEDIPGGPVELTADLMELLRLELLPAAQNAKYNEVFTQWLDASEIVYSEEAKAFATPTETAEEAAE